jgi:hypothetical protein
MSHYKDFSETVYSCLRSTVYLWPFQPDKSTDIDNDVFVSVFIHNLGELKQKLDEIDNSDINLDDFAGHNLTVTEPRIAKRRLSHLGYRTPLAVRPQCWNLRSWRVDEQSLGRRRRVVCGHALYETARPPHPQVRSL